MKKKGIQMIAVFGLILYGNMLKANIPVATGWKAAAASEIITPAELMWMSGFAFRDRPAEGKISDLRVKVLALEDRNGKRVVLISLDLNAIRKFISDNIRNALKAKYNLSRDEILINSSHTHSGPETFYRYTKDKKQQDKIKKYAKKLEVQIIQLAGKVLKMLEPATIYSGNGVVRFQVNRRNNKESSLLLQTQFAGPNDFAVPALKVVNASGRIIAIAFGYACHNSVLNGYEWSADYSGFAEEALEKEYKGATALFFQGAGGDQIAYPRHTVASAKQHGNELAAAVNRVLVGDMQKLPPVLKTTYSEIPLKYSSRFHTPDERYFSSDTARARQDSANKTFYPYPVQVWKIGEQPLITMGGEPLVEYALEFKRLFGQHVFVFGYTNDVMAYIPTTQVLREGGYEGARGWRKDLPWTLNIESIIIQEILRLSKIAGVPTIAEQSPANTNNTWKAGVATVDITPGEMLLAGFPSRLHAATGKIHDIKAKAVALQDTGNKRALLITMDMEELPKGMSDRIRDKIGKMHNLNRSQIILNCSHTHCGPVVKEISWIYTNDDSQLSIIDKYSEQLEKKIVDLARLAFSNLKPVNIYSGNGVARFQVNRRNNTESKILLQGEIKGPNDYAVPVLKITGKNKALKAIVFGYACHNSVLNGYLWSGDYAGFAQIELEKKYPGAIALFFQGAGGNQIAYPRRTIASAQFHGKTLAAAVTRIINENMQELSPGLTTAYTEIALPVSKLPGMDSIVKISKGDIPDTQKWANMLLDSMKMNKKLKTSYPYPIQVWKLGQQVLFSLGGEVVIEYALELKRMFGQDIFVAAYSNDVMAYIPTAKILNEGGYESVSSITSSSACLPSPWSVAVESIIMKNIQLIAKQAGVQLNYQQP